MKLIVRIIFLLFLYQPSFSQAGWNTLYSAYSTTSRFEDVYFVNRDTGFITGFDGKIFRTWDAGLHWSLQYSNTNTPFRSIEFLDDGVTGIAGSFADKIYRTNDNGNAWQDITAAFPGTGTQSKSICGFAHFGDSFYGVGWWGADTARLFKSTDKGLTWTVTKMNPSLITNLVDAVFLSPDTGFITGGKNTVNIFDASSQAMILKTVDGGGTWTRVFVDSVIGGRVWKIQALSHQVLVASIEPYYIDTVAMIKSTDGGNTWHEIGTSYHAPNGFNSSTGLGITQGIGFVTEKRGWLGGWYTGVFETLDGGNVWDYSQLGKNWNRIFIIDSLHAFAGGQNVYKFIGDTSTPTNNVQGTLTPPHDLYPISPNPAKGIVKIEFDLKTETNVVLEVANTDSRNISRIVSKRMKPGHYTYTWDGRNAPNGHYIVWLGTDEIPIVQKFVLER